MAMPACIAAANGFLELVLEGEPPSMAQLSKALDILAIAYHDVPNGDCSKDDPDPPKNDYGTLYEVLKQRLPEFGYYASADPAVVVDSQPTTGDAIDDLADIVGDLKAICWRYDNSGADSACWHFRFLYEIHWGCHLRDLSTYLHVKQFYCGD